MGSVDVEAGLLPAWPGVGAVPDDLVRVVRDLHSRGAVVVTLDDLVSCGVGRSPAAAARVLRRAGWLRPMRCQGAWEFATAWPSYRVAEFGELSARLLVRPDTPACIAGRSVAQVHDWLTRPTAATIGMPPKVKVPRCLDRYFVYRWEPRLGLDRVHGLPIWKPETLFVYMAARPNRFPWSDIADWLSEGCSSLSPDLLLAELESRPRAVWMKTAYIVSVGERPDLAEIVAAAAPATSRGPYLLGRRDGKHGPLMWQPVWVPRFEVMDHLFPTWWYPKHDGTRKGRPWPLPETA